MKTQPSEAYLESLRKNMVLILTGCTNGLEPDPRRDLLELVMHDLGAETWIPVTKLDPPENVPLDAFSEHYDTPVFQGEYDPNPTDTLGPQWWNSTTHDYLCPVTHPVTHWRPRPPAPAASQLAPSAGGPTTDQGQKTKDES